MFDVIVLLITCIVNLVLGGLVLVRNTKLRSSRAFFSTSFFLSAWAVTNFLTNHHFAALFYNNFFNRLAFCTAALAILSSVWFSFNFPILQTPSRRLRAILYILGASIVVLSLTPYIAGRVSYQGSDLHFSIGVLLGAYIISFLLFFAVVARNLIRVMRRYKGKERQQVVYILVGLSITTLVGLVTNAILPSITASWQTASLGPVATIGLVGTTAYSIIKHRLFDLRLAVARSLAYLLTIVVVVGLYAVMAFGLSDLIFNLNIGLDKKLFLTLFSVLTAILFQPVKKFFDKITNRYFYRDAYDPQELLNTLNKVLVSTTNLTRLSDGVTATLKASFKSEYCAVILMDPKTSVATHVIGSGDQKFTGNDLKTMHTKALVAERHPLVIATDDLEYADSSLKRILVKDGVAVLAQIGHRTHNGNEALGHLLFGQKRSGNPYSSQDLRIIETIANELVIAFQNALRFEEIENFNATLQQKVDDATHKLRRTNEKLRQLDETKDDFISMASHQLRTPLTSVKGYVSMVIDGDAGELTQMQRKLLTQAFISSQRMVYLISDLLNVSRLRTGKFIIETVPVNLSTVVQEEVKQLVETAKGRNLQLVYHKPEHFPSLMLDETKMRQVIMNFIDNAIYYTPSGGTITVSLVERPQVVELTVTDNGIGVPKSEQHHLFSKFYRADNAKRARPDGTGLGLFMAKKVIMAQGGSVVFKSKEGAGSTFGFTFAKTALVPQTGD